jgi:OOP family OmpA-OmpF porin
MNINLMDLLKSQLGGQVVEQASKFLGEESSATQSAMSGILPTLMGGLIGKTSTTEGANSIFNLIKSGNHDGGILNNLTGLFSNGAQNQGIMNVGTSLLSSIFGNKVGNIVDMITSFSGMKKSSSSSLLSMAAPLVMGLLGKQVKDNGLNASGLASLLGGQKNYVKDAMPAGLGGMFSKFGLGDMVDSFAGTAKNVGAKTAAVATETVNAGKSGISKFLPWLLLLAALLLGFYFLRGCGGTGSETIDNAVNTVTETTDNIADATKDAAKDAADAVADAFSSITLPGGVSLNIPKGSLVDKFATFLASNDTDLSKYYTFDHLLFETGNDKLMPESQQQLNDLTAVLKAYPSVNVKLVGNTDNTGDAAANKKLSLARAKSVKADLVTKGIDSKRIETEGVGDANPIATNDTEEGKQQNRRIDLYVTKK